MPHTSLTRYTLRSTAVTDPDPVAVLTNLDAVLAQERHRRGTAFCTVIFGVLTVRPGHCEVTLAGGGHPPALLLRAGGTAGFVELAGGQLLGAIPGARFVRDVVDLGPGDTLLLYTDGLVEARIDHDRTRYDEDDLLVFGGGIAPVSAAEAVAATTRLVEGFGEGIDDDVALLAIGVPR